MRPPSPSTARWTFSAVVSWAWSGWEPTGTKRGPIPPSAQMPRLVFSSLAMRGSLTFRRIHGAALVGRPVQGGDHARLRERVVATEERRRVVAHGRLEVLQL